LWLFTGAVQTKYNNVDQKLDIFNQSCQLRPDSFHVIENGPVFLRKCVTNSTDSTIWEELNSNVAQSTIQLIPVLGACTTTNSSTHPNFACQSQGIVNFDRLHPVTCSAFAVRATVPWRPSALMDFYVCLEQSKSSSNGPIVIILNVWTFAENETFCLNTYTTGMRICAVSFDERICNISI